MENNRKISVPMRVFAGLLAASILFCVAMELLSRSRQLVFVGWWTYQRDFCRGFIGTLFVFCHRWSQPVIFA